MSDSVQISRFRDAVLRVDHAVGQLISRDVEDANLRDARCLLTSSLMRAVGITKFLAANPDQDPGSLVELRRRIHQAFGAPGDWGGELGDALRDLYRLYLAGTGN